MLSDSYEIIFNCKNQTHIYINSGAHICEVMPDDINLN